MLGHGKSAATAGYHDRDAAYLDPRVADRVRGAPLHAEDLRDRDFEALESRARPRGYYDPNYDYLYGHERLPRPARHDVHDPYLLAHEKALRRAAAHGDLDPYDPLGSVEYGRGGGGLFRGRTRTRTPSPVLTSPRAASATADHRRHHHHEHDRDRYAPAEYDRIAPTHHRARRAASVDAPPVASRAHVVGRYPGDTDTRGYSRSASAVRAEETISERRAPSPVFDTLDADVPVAWYPSGRRAVGELRTPDGTALPVSGKHAIPYGTGAPATTTRARRSASTGGGLKGLVARLYPETTTTTVRHEPHAYATGARGPVTTIAAIDRANKIALFEEELAKPMSYTKIGGYTIVHDEYGPGRTVKLPKWLRPVRGSPRGAGAFTHTTTEEAILRANVIASEEARRDYMRRRSFTKIGMLNL
ncbi:hypothetical protein GGF32_002320 [Allomyces javanicus]|nr:hypothetical protein GGF32_002320 [Allomyces javanicus]